jgi:hypothetical protein
MARYGVIDSNSNTVINSINWDGVEPWTPPDGTFVEELCESSGIGWIWDGEKFIQPVDDTTT